MISLRQYIFTGLCTILMAFMFCAGAIASDDDKNPKKEGKEPWEVIDAPFVVELFTDENCFPCTLADALLYKLSQEKNVIALSCHVKDKALNSDLDPDLSRICENRHWAYDTKRWRRFIELERPEFIINGRVSFISTEESTINNKLFLATRAGFRDCRRNESVVDDDAERLSSPP